MLLNLPPAIPAPRPPPPPPHSAARAARRPAVDVRLRSGAQKCVDLPRARPPPLPPRVEIIETSPTARLEPVWRQRGPPQACGPAPRRRRRPGTAGPARARSVGA